MHIREDFGDFDLETTLMANREEQLTSIIAYCLMPNHFHILAKESTENGISAFMQKLSTAYTMYFNKKYSRTRNLFQGRFKAQFADEDTYLKYLVSYIHLNPIKLIEPTWKELGIQNLARAEDFLSTYEYSSYPDFIGKKRKMSVILSRDELPPYFEDEKNFKDEVKEWLNYKTK